MHRPAIARLARHGGLAMAELPPPYLAPSLHFSTGSTATQTSSFSTTPVAAGRSRGRDRNPNRGVSAIHRTGPRFKLSISDRPLPTPVPRKEMAKRVTNPDHGLWGFFPSSREALSTPEDDSAFGRSWSIQELRHKSWEDIHSLWWVCVRERNRIATSNIERLRLKAGYGEHEASERDDAIRVTQQVIKHVLRERWYAWEDARQLLEEGHLPEEMKKNTQGYFVDDTPEEPQPARE